MPGRPPLPAHQRAGLALVSLVVVALALGAVAPVAAVSPDVTDDPLNETTTDTRSTVTETTDDATSTVETETDDTTSDVEDPGSTTDETVETRTETTSDPVVTVNETADRLVSELKTTTERRLAEAGVTDPTATLDPTIDGTTEPLSETIASNGHRSDDVLLAESVVGTDEAVDGPKSEDGVAESAHASRSGDPVPTPTVASSEPSGTTEPVSPLTAGVTAFGGLLVGAVALRQGFGVASTAGLPTVRDVRGAAGAGAAGLQDGCRWLGGLFGYQRYDDSDPLEHETRVALLEAIGAADAAYLAGVARDSGVPLSTARYHLKVLEQESVVRSVELRGKRLYVPAGDEPSELQAALADDAAATVLDALARRGPDTVSGLAEAIGRDVSTLTHHLQMLESAGLVERERDGRAVRNRLAPAVREAMASGDGAAGDGASTAAARSD